MTEHGYSLEDFVGAARREFARNRFEDAGIKIKEHLEAFLRHPSLVETYVGKEDVEAQKPQVVIYKDADFGFMVLAHFFAKPMQSPPHDHGPCWVCYGVYRGATSVTTYRRLDDGSKPGRGELEVAEEFTLEAGQARCFAPYDIHRIQHRDGRHVVLRVTARDVEIIERHSFDLEKKTVNTVKPHDTAWNDKPGPLASTKAG